MVAPFYTALTTLVAQPPMVTPPGLTGYPNNEVETGDSTAGGDSGVFAVFYVESDAVYAEQPVTISSAQLEARCIRAWGWEPGNPLQPLAQGASGVGVNTGPPAETTLDNDGNAVFIFRGISCAAGDRR